MSECFGIEPVEEEGRIYPRSLEASSVAQAIIAAAQRSFVDIRCGVRAVSVKRTPLAFITSCEGCEDIMSLSLILATGGKAGIQYGCYGDGYRLAESLGHSVVKPIPALDGLTVEEDISVLHGVRVRAKASVLRTAGGKTEELASEAGEVQFTKDAVSGICVMDLSRNVRLAEGAAYRLSLDLFPEMDKEELLEKLRYRKKMFGSGMIWLVPEKLKDYMRARMTPENYGFEAMAELAKGLTFNIKGTRGWKTAQVTCGGVPLSEVDPYSFESLKMKELYITGELLDYDGPCGGYNLAWAFHSGLSAGTNAAMGETQQ